MLDFKDLPLQPPTHYLCLPLSITFTNKHTSQYIGHAIQKYKHRVFTQNREDPNLYVCYDICPLTAFVNMILQQGVSKKQTEFTDHCVRVCQQKTFLLN